MMKKSSFEDVPEDLIHHIQSFLPVKEAARTCILSKSWLHAWQTIPNLNFPFKFISQVNENFMNHTLQRYQTNNIPIRSFDLGMRIYNDEAASLAENWIRHVSNPKTCPKELSFDIWILNYSLITLPLELFSSENLKSITVTALTSNGGRGVKFCDSLFSNPVMIKCVSLRALDLKFVSIADNVLANLLSTCKLLENIRLICCRDLKTVKVKNLAFLRELKIHLRDPNSVLEITDVPALRLLGHSYDLSISKPVPFQMDSLGSVTQLKLGNVLMDNAFFDIIKSKLPLLESLTLIVWKWAVENWVISSVSLRSLKLKFYTRKQFLITVCAPNLISCVCKCRKQAPLISFATTTPKHYDVTSL